MGYACFVAGCSPGERLMPFAAIAPLPTTSRQVSGKRAAKRLRNAALKMAKNQNIDLPPRY